MKTIRKHSFFALMKTCVCSGFCTPVLLLLLLICSINYTSYGQEHPYPSSLSTDNGYWKHRTDHKSGKTIVWFYNQYDELIYKEEFKNNYLKLTKGNIGKLDGILHSLLNNNLIKHAGIKTNPFPIHTKQSLVDKTESEERPNGIALPLSISESSTPSLRAMASASTKLPHVIVTINNPKQERLLLTIVEDKISTNAYDLGFLKPSIYRQSITSPSFQRTLDLSSLEEGSYKLEIAGKHNAFTYRVQIVQQHRGKKIHVQLY